MHLVCGTSEFTQNVGAASLAGWHGVLAQRWGVASPHACWFFAPDGGKMVHTMTPIKRSRRFVGKNQGFKHLADFLFVKNRPRMSKM